MANATIAHLYQDSQTGVWRIQTNEEHCKGVACLTSKFCKSFGMEEYGHMCGMLHDLGKQRLSFQNYIRNISGYDTTCRIDSDHSHAYVGAIAAFKTYGHAAIPAAAAIAGHHRGLYDQDALFDILRNKDLPPEIRLPDPDTPRFTIPAVGRKHDLHMLGRMIFSALVDADYLDTERFMKPDDFASRSGYASVQTLAAILEHHLDKIRHSADKTAVNEIRNLVQNYCRSAAAGACGIYSLTVPTGGGKTLSSVLWALRHCIANSMEGVIIAIPYTSIIEQTAKILRDIFGARNVLEHHSAVDQLNCPDSDPDNPGRLATENWDCPIVVTTNVQLFESLYHNKSSRCRKLHNIANRVIILDETQTLPPELLKPLTASLDTLNRVFHCSVLLTTASQPVLYGRINGCGCQSFEGFRAVSEIIPPEEELHKKLRRVEFSFIENRTSYEELAREMARENKVLCIVNTRKAAARLYSRLTGTGCNPLHLSRMMCPVHLRETLGKAKRMLEDPDCKRLALISTQLIEAGVDIDFPVVYRQEAGLDSILQAAGRCNREGRLSQPGKVHIFALEANNSVPRGMLTAANDARKNMPTFSDISSPEAIAEFFRQFYARCGDFDKHNIAADLWENNELNYETAARKFSYIENNSIAVVVNYANAAELIDQIKKGHRSRKLFRDLAGFSVNISRHDFNALHSKGAVEEVAENIFWLWSEKFYNNDTGIDIDGNWTEETFII